MARPSASRRAGRHGGLLPLLALVLVGSPAAEAGHESPFYPSFYPQEIKIERVEPNAAVAPLETSKLHAYVGHDLFAGGPLPKNVGSVESFGSYVVLTFRPGAVPDHDRRCVAGAPLVAALGRLGGSARGHPYPVTPFDPDYLQHADLARAREQALAGAGDAAGGLKLRARGALAQRLVPGAQRAGAADADATVDEVSLDDLLADQRTATGGPPWVNEGWFHAWLLLEPTLGDSSLRQAAAAAYRRLTTGGFSAERERLAVERQLVSQLAGGCERIVLGYTVRREEFSAEYSDGVENVAADAHDGLRSAIFIRTVKLKDFPWNGWLRLGVDRPGAAAWNPVGGFTDPTGRLLWAALDDPAVLPSPRGVGWIANRVRSVRLTRGPVAVPPEAVLPEAGTGVLRPVGPGRTAAAKLEYRVVLSATHDGSRMTAADTLYALSFAFRWGSGGQRDPLVAQRTSLLREWLAGIRLLKVDTETKTYGEDLNFAYEVPVVEIYLAHPGGSDALGLATIAPPWSAVPWHITALMEEAVRRGLGAFSDGEARRRGVPWLDLADPKQHDLLMSLVEELRARAFVPDALRNLVGPGQARQRWTALKEFADKHGHFLVTSGPYRLAKRSPDTVTLDVFRDLTYPLGVGAFDGSAIPLRAYATLVERRGNWLEVAAEVEQVSRFSRTYEVVRGPLTAAVTDVDVPVCRYVVVGAEGALVAAGAARYVGGGRYALDLAGLPPAPATVLIALVVADNAVQPAITTVRLGAGGGA